MIIDSSDAIIIVSARNPMSRYIAAAMICLFASKPLAQAAEGGAAPTSSKGGDAKSTASMEEPALGDFWTFDVLDEIGGSSKRRKYVITELTASEIRVQLAVTGETADQLNVYDRSWNLKSAGNWKYQPMDGSGIRAPLKVGAVWDVTADDVNSQNGFIFKRSVNSNVVGQETITTRAGTFDTFKIETAVSTRSTNDPSRKSEISAQTWYAPAIDHWVKRTIVVRVNNHLMNSSTSELVEYGRKK
jgi:hypothetical protein